MLIVFDKPVALARFSWIVPSPVPVLTGTVQVMLSLVVGVPTLAPETPVVVKLKLLAVTPVTAVPNTAEKLTDEALVNWPVTLFNEFMVVGLNVVTLAVLPAFDVVK